jgi:hypothetical protein
MNNKIEFKYNIVNDSNSNLIQLEFSIINHSNRTIYFSRRNTPFDNYLSDCFTIQYNNDSLLKFDGLFVKRFQESKIDILKLKPYETLSTKLQLNDSYKFTSIGIYSIIYNISYFRFSFNLKSLINSSYCSSKLEIINNAISFEIFNKLVSLQTLGDKFRKSDKDISGEIKFKFADDTQKAILRKLTNDILDIFTKPFILGKDNFYELWFGKYSVVNFITVSSNFTYIFSEINKRSITYVIDNGITLDRNGKPVDRYAQTYQDSSIITLFPAFWNKAKDS